MQSAAVQKRLAQDEILTEPMDPAQFTKFVADEVARWRPISQNAGFATQ